MGYLLEALPYKLRSHFGKNESHHASIFMGNTSVVARRLHIARQLHRHREMTGDNYIGTRSATELQP
jgi:hypothetical protein